MTTIKADPAELRRLANELRHSASHLRQLGDQAVVAAASAHSPAAAGTMAEAASFAAGAHVAELETGALATGTERVADLFEAADRGGGWFSREVLFLVGRWGAFGNKLRKIGKGVHALWKNIPHDLSRASWREWQRQLKDARYNVARFWGQRGAINTLRAWKNTQLKMLRNSKTSTVRFLNQGVRAVKDLSKNTTLLGKVAPLRKFATKAVGKVLKPLNLVHAYKTSKAGSPIGKATSVFFQTVLVKNPIVVAADVVTGGQLSKGVDGVVSTIASVGDSERLNAMSQANAKGENGAVMQAIEFVGDDLIAEGLYNGWNWIANGH